MRRVASVTTPSCPSRPADKAQPVVCARIHVRAADLGHAAVHRDHRQPEQVVRRHPVFQAMRAARVHRDVAGNRAGKLGGRVGGIEEAGIFDRAGDGQVRAPGLDPDAAALMVDLENPGHPRNAKHDAVTCRQRPSGKGRAGTARHDRDALLAADAQHLRNFVRGTGEGDAERRAGVGRQRIALVRPGFDRIGLDVPVGKRGLQAADDSGLPAKHVWGGRGHVHRMSSGCFSLYARSRPHATCVNRIARPTATSRTPAARFARATARGEARRRRACPMDQATATLPASGTSAERRQIRAMSCQARPSTPKKPGSTPM